jgi:hypothetical protein
MMNSRVHSFHIPVLGLAFSINTPLKVAKYGISSVVSLVDDVLVEDMRSYHCKEYDYTYVPIKKNEPDSRARRITAYLDLLDEIIKKQIESIKRSSLSEPSELTKYLEMLGENSSLKKLYYSWLKSDNESDKAIIEEKIKNRIEPGDINVNIMAKIDKTNFDHDGNPLASEQSDALAALRGFANSTVSSSVVISAGFNARLFSYISTFKDFLPDSNGDFVKSVILKVSDFRSAYVQGKFLAKKGIWISEFRVESGLNCGGHAFATDGYLLGPILEEFKTKRDDLREELYRLCLENWKTRSLDYIPYIPQQKLGVQGGIGTANEQKFLLDYYKVDSAGWGTPFLLVPEATNVDEYTCNELASATEKDLYLSGASPLGVPFNNLRNSLSEQQIKKRLNQNRPGSPCIKKFLVSNREFTKEPICTASRQYQHDKLLQISKDGNADLKSLETIFEKACLCEDLSAPSYILTGMKQKVASRTSICPGPNIAYFSEKYSLKQMVDHINGRTNLLNDTYRPNMFINELKMYIDYLAGEINKQKGDVGASFALFVNSFKTNLKGGIDYYKKLIPQIECETNKYLAKMKSELESMECRLAAILIPQELIPIQINSKTQVI